MAQDTKLRLAKSLADELTRQSRCTDISAEDDLTEFMVFESIDLDALAASILAVPEIAEALDYFAYTH